MHCLMPCLPSHMSIDRTMRTSFCGHSSFRVTKKHYLKYQLHLLKTSPMWCPELPWVFSMPSILPKSGANTSPEMMKYDEISEI